MQQVSYPRIAEQCYQCVLPCGMTIRVLPKPDFTKTYAMLAVGYGSVDMDFSYLGRTYQTPAGVAHYLEHKMFEMPEGNAMQSFSKLGASPNAFTSYNMTAYHFSTTENAEKCLQLLLHMVLTPYFTDESVEKERGIIGQELRMYEDNPDSQVYERLFAAMFRTHPLRIPIGGTLGSIEKISAQTLQFCYDAFYKPSNMILCVKGNLTPEQVLAIAERAAPADSPAPVGITHYGQPEPLCCGTAATEKQMQVAMPMFLIGWRGADIKRGDACTEIAGDLASELLMGESSPLYQRLYEQGLIDSDFSAGFESVRNLSLISAGGDSKNPYAVRDAIVDEAARLVREGIDTADFNRLKKSALGRRIRDLDGFDGTCYRICSYFFDGVNYLEFPQAYDAVTEESVLSVLKNFITPEQMTISVIQPCDEEES